MRKWHVNKKLSRSTWGVVIGGVGACGRRGVVIGNFAFVTCKTCIKLIEKKRAKLK
jgi:hypothetical protein